MIFSKFDLQSSKFSRLRETVAKRHLNFIRTFPTLSDFNLLGCWIFLKDSNFFTKPIWKCKHLCEDNTFLTKMGWFRKIIFLPFSMYMIVLKFVFRISIKIISKLFENKFEENSDEKSRKGSASKNEFGEDPRVRSLSGNESRSRKNSGTKNAIEIRSRNNSGNNNSSEVRSRHNSGNSDVRSRHNSGNGPGPGLLHRSDSIVHFPAASPQSGIRSRRSSCSTRTITMIHVDQKLKEDKMRSLQLQHKLQKLAAERNEQRYVHKNVKLPPVSD